MPLSLEVIEERLAQLTALHVESNARRDKSDAEKDEKLDKILVQTTRTNGRADALESWRNEVTPKIAVLLEKAAEEQGAKDAAAKWWTRMAWIPPMIAGAGIVLLLMHAKDLVAVFAK